MNDPNRGAVLLKTFLAASRRSQADAGRAVDVSDVTVHHWLTGIFTPRSERREALREWSGGAVPTEAWDASPDPADLAMLDAALAAQGPQASEPGAAA